MARDLTLLAAALLMVSAVAFTRQRRLLLTVCGALFVAVVLFVGFATVPAAFWTGVLKAPTAHVTSLQTSPPEEN